jgi:hypothetical protein
MLYTVVLAAAWLMAIAPFPAGAATMTNDDVIQLVKAGMSEALILSAIDASDPQFDASATGTVSARISGKRASHRIRSKTPVFLDLGTLEGQSPEDAFALVGLDVKGSDRILIIGETSASLFGGYVDRAKFKDRTQVPLKLEKVQENCTIKSETLTIYRGVPASPLTPGAYALLYGERFHDFGVDP